MKERLIRNIGKNLTRISPYLNIQFQSLVVKKKLVNFKNPITFDEKLNFLKLNSRDNLKLMSICSDKVAVKDYLDNMGYGYLLNTTIGVYDHEDDIDFNKIPFNSVLKLNHDSGSTLMLSDFDKNYSKVKKKLEKFRKDKFYLYSSELHYKYIKPKILIEENLIKNNEPLYDYKVYCFNGKPKYIMLCIGRELGTPKFIFFDKNQRLIKINNDSKSLDDNYDKSQIRFDKFDEIFKISENLSSPFKFVRIDFFITDERVYFGEMTFFPQGGFDAGKQNDFDIHMGDLLKL